jgi:hypothetical protein
VGTWLEPWAAESLIIIMNLAAVGNIFCGVSREFLDRGGVAARLGRGTLVKSILRSFGNTWVLIIIVIDYPNRFVNVIVL